MLLVVGGLGLLGLLGYMAYDTFLNPHTETQGKSARRSNRSKPGKGSPAGKNRGNKLAHGGQVVATAVPLQRHLVDLNIAVMQMESARYREEMTVVRQKKAVAAAAYTRFSNALSGRVDLHEHLTPEDKIVAINEVDLPPLPGEGASLQIDRALRTVYIGTFIQFKVLRGGTNLEMHIFFPLDGSRVSKGLEATERIKISREVAIQIQNEILSLPPESLSRSERQKIEGILGKSEATPEEFSYLTRRLTAGASVLASRRKEGNLIERNYAALHGVRAGLMIPDAVVTSEGKRIEGKIVNDDATGVTIEKKYGAQITIPRTGIRYVTLADETRKDFERKFTGAEARADVNGLEALLAWTRDRELSEHRQLVAWAILKKDSNNRNARRALGFRYDGTSWVKASEAAVAVRAKNRVDLKAELQKDGFVHRVKGWFIPTAWEVSIDNLHSPSKMRISQKGAKIFTWEEGDTPNSRAIDSVRLKGLGKRLRFFAPSGGSGSVTIAVEAPGEILECDVKATSQIIALGGAAKIEVFVKPGNRGTSLVRLYGINQGRNEQFHGVSQLRGSTRFTVTALMTTTHDSYHTYARFLPCIPETREVFVIRGKVLRPAPDIDKIWESTPY